MWKIILSVVKQLFSVAKETQQNKTDINELRERLKSKEEEEKELRREQAQDFVALTIHCGALRGARTPAKKLDCKNLSLTSA